MNRKAVNILLIGTLVFIIGETVSASYGSAAGFGEGLSLSETPPSDHKGGKHKPGRGGGDAHSEHRAEPVKKFYLNTHSISDSAQAYIVRPDGTLTDGKLTHGEDGWSISVDTKPMNKESDGIFNVYVVDRELVDETLVVKVAKLNVINHSCGWGHEYKFDEERQRPKSLPSIPLEIVGNGLWNESFHSSNMSGETLNYSVLYNGTPADGAKMKVVTQSGWMKMLRTDSQGNASFQLIRDYYPEKWIEFNSRKRGNFMLTAEYEVDEVGEFSGSRYSKMRMISTLPWRYYPQKDEYSSYAYGLSIGVAFALVSGLGVYIHRKRNSRPYREVRFD